MLEHHGMTRGEHARRSHPGEALSQHGKSRPTDQEEHGEEANGDGMHHHELHEHEDGSFHSKHTHPDGRVEEADHGSYEEARDHMDAMHGHDGEPEEAEHEPDGDEPEDLAGMYARG